MKIAEKNRENKIWLDDEFNRLIFELYVSYLYARRGGKRSTADEHKFEIFEFYNLRKLAKSIKASLYEPSRGVAHIIYNPVIREIFAAAFRDRVVHHWLYLLIYEFWEDKFILDSYSCREGKGTLFGILRMQEQMQEAMKKYPGERIYVVKMDIQGYFVSINRALLYKIVLEGLDEQFKGNYNLTYRMAKYCLYQIIMDNPCKGAKRIGWPYDWRRLPHRKSLIFQKPGIGIVIGNLTSQLLSNIFLNKLDQYITQELGWKFYGRYVDDFYIILPESMLAKFHSDRELIDAFLKRMGLTRHPDKYYEQPIERGAAFLGAVVYPTAIHPGKRVKKNTRRAFRNLMDGKGSIETVVSYIGHMRYMKHDKFLSDVCEEVGLPRDFWRQYEKPRCSDDPKEVLLKMKKDAENEIAGLKRMWRMQEEKAFSEMIK